MPKALSLILLLGLSACSGGDKFTISANTNNGDTGSSTGASVSGSISNGPEKIINGLPLDSTISPQIVRIDLTYNDGTAGICSGTAITSEVVLTAAHCFPAEVIGATVTSALATTKVESVIIHPAYTVSLELNAIFNDVALVSVPGANLPSLSILASIPVTVDSPLIAYGYGLNENGEAGKLQNAPIGVGAVTPNHIFSTPFDGDNADPCYGDSGGPAILGFTDNNGNFGVGIVGVVSSGTEQGCAKGDITLFTNLQEPGMAEFIALNAPGAVIL
ncbi:MAG: trypsin-like serine protease [Oligoflexia bacterium]|nr:trypsin-like serine protease [Oligoflexia bacterium]